VVNFYPHGMGGGQMYVLMLAKELQKRGYTVAVLTLIQHGWKHEAAGTNDGSITEYSYQAIDVYAVRINLKSITQGQKYAVNHPILRARICDVMKKFSPDIIHVNGINSAIYPVALELQIPTITTIHHSGAACPAGTLIYHDGTICSLAMHHSVCIECCSYQRMPESRLSGYFIGKIPRWFYLPYGKIVDTSKKLLLPLRILQYPWLVEQEMNQLRSALDAQSMLIAPSRAIKDLLLRNGVREKNIFLLPHGVKELKKAPIEAFNVRPVAFGFVGHAGHIKGVHILMSALEKISHGDRCELHMYGDSENNSYFISILTKYKGQARIIQHGLLRDDQLQAAYTAMDVLVLPSLAYEAFGLVVNEALASGRPVIVSRSGALPELVEDGKTGFIVARNDSSALAEKMQLYIDNPQLILEMSQNIGTIKMCGQYTEELISLYESYF
jgi:glycosyltransferase involved in cell wall biosynthesis